MKEEMAAKVAKAKVDVVQVYKDDFKDTMDYLFLMRDAVNEYKASIKRVDPTFDGDYYDRLISGEPATPAPEDSNKAPLEVAKPEQENAPAQMPVQPAEQQPEASASPPA